MSDLESELAAELSRLSDAGLERRCRRLESAPGARAILEGREVLVFGSSNYLGLAEHPTVRRAVVEAVERWGTGASGSRLTTGNLAIHEALESALAKFKGTEAALVFGSGYAAAVGTIPALVSDGDLILSDALNHASLIDGCRLSRATVRVYRHCDVDRARALLEDRSAFRRCLLVTDAVFSMDGDLAPLPSLADLCDATDTWLMTDDAHGTGVLGAQGTGSLEYLGVNGRIPVQMGTLSKAIGAEGGFIAGSQTLIDYVRNRARSFIFATAPAPATMAAALAALGVIRAEPERRARLMRRATFLRDGLREICRRLPESESADVPPGVTPIIPITVGSAERAVRLSSALEQEGVWAPAIRPPSVPDGSSRLRMTVTANHTEDEIEAALRTFRNAIGA